MRMALELALHNPVCAWDLPVAALARAEASFVEVGELHGRGLPW